MAQAQGLERAQQPCCAPFASLLLCEVLPCCCRGKVQPWSPARGEGWLVSSGGPALVTGAAGGCAASSVWCIHVEGELGALGCSGSGPGAGWV